MKPTIRLFILLCIVHGLVMVLIFLAAYNGQWMGATALLFVSLLVLGQQVRMLRVLGCARKWPGFAGVSDARAASRVEGSRKMRALRGARTGSTS